MCSGAGSRRGGVMTEPAPNGEMSRSSDDMDDALPPTEPKGALIPPPRKPPTAVGAFASQPEPRPPRPMRRWDSPINQPDIGRAIVRAVDGILDLLDAVGDSVRENAARLAR